MSERTGLLDHSDLPPLPTSFTVAVGTATATITEATLRVNERTGTTEAHISYQLDQPVGAYAEKGATPDTIPAGKVIGPQRLKIKAGDHEKGNCDIDYEKLGRIIGNVHGLKRKPMANEVEDLLLQLEGKTVTVILKERVDKVNGDVYQEFGKVVARNGAAPAS